jgi:hypothetical protein
MEALGRLQEIFLMLAKEVAAGDRDSPKTNRSMGALAAGSTSMKRET